MTDLSSQDWKWEASDETELVLHNGDILEDAILWCTRCDSCVKKNRLCGWPEKEYADLIEAAPKLLAACMMAKEALIDAGGLVPNNVYFDNKTPVDQLDAAIACAKGVKE